MTQASLPVPLRVAAAMLCLLSLASAYENWRAVLVVGSDGIWVRRVFSRLRLRWWEVAGFQAERSGLRRLVVRAVLRDGRRRPLSDHGLDYAEGQRLLEDLAGLLESRRRP